MLFSWLVTMASRPKGKHLRRVTLKMAKAESSTSPIACGRGGGYKTDGIREYYRYDCPTHGRDAPGASDPSPRAGAPELRRRNHRRDTRPRARHNSGRHARRPIA